MKTLTIFSGIVVALLLAAISYAAELLLPLFFGRYAAMVTIALIALLYLCYLLRYSSLRAGKLTLAACCAVLLAAPIMLYGSLSATAITAVIVIWLARSLLYAPGFLITFVDLAVCLLGAALALYAALRGYSIVAAVWCFLLTQALWATLPKRSNQRPAQQQTATEPDRFNRAHANAEMAIRRLLGGTNAG